MVWAETSKNPGDTIPSKNVKHILYRMSFYD